MASKSNLSYEAQGAERPPLPWCCEMPTEARRVENSPTWSSTETSPTRRACSVALTVQRHFHEHFTLHGMCTDALPSDLGPYMAVFKTHIDRVQDFTNATVDSPKRVPEKHNFMIFEDRKLVDISNTVQKQYHGGSLTISKWAEIVNLSILGGEAIVTAPAQTQTVSSRDFPYVGERGFLILAEMTPKGSLATGLYTEKCIEAARRGAGAVIGFVVTRALTEVAGISEADKDFLVFTTAIKNGERRRQARPAVPDPSRCCPARGRLRDCGQGNLRCR